MPIQPTDLLWKYSASGASAGNATAGSAASSLGKYISTTQIPDGVLDNVFDDVTGTENAASNVDYKCIFLHNNHATLTLTGTVVWIASQVAGGADAAIATDNLGPKDVGSSSAQAAVIANEDTAPTGVSAFSAPAGVGSGLSLGNIGPGQCVAIWIRRTANNSAALNNDGLTLQVQGSTTA